MHDVLGHERCAAAGGDYGGVVIQDLGLRFEGFVARQCLFNTVLPLLRDEYEAAGLEVTPSPEARMAADYFFRQGREADALAAELDTPDKRRRYVATFYGPRFWASPGSFAPEDVDFMTEPFADGDKLRASFGTVRVRAGHAAGLRGAALPRAQPRADAGAVRPRRPRDLAATSRGAPRWRFPTAWGRSSSPERGTSSSGSGRNCSTVRWSPSCATFSRRT